MALKKNMKFKTKVINLKALAEVSGVSMHKIYNRRHVKIEKPLSLNERTKLVNVLAEDIVRMSKELGFKLTTSIEEIAA